MAHRRWPISASDQRGQMVLVGGLVLAFTFIALALLLNAGIFTENLATQQTGQPAGDAHFGSNTVTAGVGKQLTAVNTQTSADADHQDLVENFTEGVTNWTVTVNRHYGVDGKVITVEVVETAPGSRIVQDNGSRNLTAGGTRVGASTWTVFDGVDARNVTWFEMNLTSLNVTTLDDTLDETLNESLTVRFVETTSGDVWRVHVFRANVSGNAYVLVEEPEQHLADSPGAYVDYVSDACLTGENQVRIDFWEGTVAGEPCDRLSFTGDLTGQIEVRFENTTSNHQPRGLGRYDILLNETDIDEDVYVAGSTGQSPYSRTALTWARIGRTYRDGDIMYSETESVHPTKEAPVAPIDSPNVNFDVNDSSGSEFTTALEVNWAVSDRNADLQTVTVTIDDAGGSQVYREVHTVRGGNADGVNAHTDTDNHGPYTITVTVTDYAGNSATTVQEHDADGDNRGDPP